MGFLINVFQQPQDPGDFDEALKMHVSRRKRARSVMVEAKHCRIVCLDDGCASQIWRQNAPGGSCSSFVYVTGWCYRISSSGEEMVESQFLEMLNRHQEGLPPLDEDFSGNYAVVVYDAQSGRIAIQPDRWAMMAVHFAETQNGIVVSNRAITVASLIHAPINGLSFISMLRGTHMPFGSSLFSGVHRVMCGCYLELETHSTRIKKKRAFPIYIPVEERTFDESVETAKESVCRMAGRVLGCRSAVFDLTGGHDSRLTASAISQLGCEPGNSKIAWRVVGPENHPDVQIARRIAALCNWRLLRLDNFSPRNASLEELQNTAVLSEGASLISSAFSRVRQETSYLDEWDWHVGSLGGEMFRGFLWKQEALSLGRTSKVDFSALLAYRLYASRAIDFQSYLKDAPSLDEHDQALLKPYREIGEVGGDRVTPYKLDAMYIHKLCYGAGNILSWLVGFRNVRLPLLCWEVTRDILAMPWRHRANRALQLRTIALLNPALSEIPNDRGEPMEVLSPRSSLRYLKAKFVLGCKQSPRIIRRYTGKQIKESAIGWEALPAELLSLVTHPKCIEAIVDPALLTRVNAEITGPNPSTDWVRTFYGLLTLELLLRDAPAIRRQVEFLPVTDIQS